MTDDRLSFQNIYQEQLFYLDRRAAANISYPSSAAAVVLVCIFPLGLHFGLTGIRPQSAPACSFLRYAL